MKKAILSLALIMPAASYAATPDDTTFVYKDKKIVVNVEDDATQVSVYDKKGNKLAKSSETTFVDGNEIQKVYVGSPFMEHEKLQDNFTKHNFPSVWVGYSATHKGVAKTKTNHTHNKASFEIGFSAVPFCWALDKAHTMGIATTLQFAYIRTNFAANYSLSMEGDRVAMTDQGEKAKHSYMDYFESRLPVMFTLYPESKKKPLGVSLGLALVYRDNANYTFSRRSSAPDIDSSIKLKHFGLNVIGNISYGPVVLSANLGITPTYKSTEGWNAYNSSVNIGVNLWELLRKK